MDGSNRLEDVALDLAASPSSSANDLGEAFPYFFNLARSSRASFKCSLPAVIELFA